MIESWDKRVRATRLHQAAREGDEEAVKSLLNAGADINAKDINEVTPLHEAALWGHKEVIELLLDYGADIEAHTDNGWTPLHSAVNRGVIDAVGLLLKRGAKVNDNRAQNADGVGHTPLFYAVTRHDFRDVNYEEVAKLLRQYGAIDK